MGGFDSSSSKAEIFLVDFLRLDEDELTLSELIPKWLSKYRFKLFDSVAIKARLA